LRSPFRRRMSKQSCVTDRPTAVHPRFSWLRQLVGNPHPGVDVPRFPPRGPRSFGQRPSPPCTTFWGGGRFFAGSHARPSSGPVPPPPSNPPAGRWPRTCPRLGCRELRVTAHESQGQLAGFSGRTRQPPKGSFLLLRRNPPAPTVFGDWAPFVPDRPRTTNQGVGVSFLFAPTRAVPPPPTHPRGADLLSFLRRAPYEGAGRLLGGLGSRRHFENVRKPARTTTGPPEVG